MYTEEDLASAVGAGILTEEAAAAFRAHVAQRQGDSVADEEQFRLVTGFNDIFVVIACLLSLVSAAWIGAGIGQWLGALGATALAWGLAEFFVRRRRMALPAIVLLLAFVGGAFATVVLSGDASPGSLALGGAVAAAAAWAHWQRFRVPITVAAGAAAVAGGIVALVLYAAPAAASWIQGLSFVAGIGVFALAMRWDMADRERQTRKSDVAFWLHLLAAPLIVRPVFALLDVLAGDANLWQGVAVLVLYGAIGLVSLAIDRRALMVSALAYVLYTISALFAEHGAVSLGFAIAGLSIGSALLLLSAFWHASRGWVLARLPSGLQRRLAVSR